VFPTETFFADVEQVIAEAGGADRLRLHKLVGELNRVAVRMPGVAERCYAYEAKLLVQLQEFEQALVAVEKALLLMPLDEDLLILRGDIYRSADEFSLALQDYTQVLSVHPDSVTARLRRAEVRQARGQFSDALDDMNEALHHEPRSLRLLYRRALILIDLGRATEAQADFASVARLSPAGDLKEKAQARLRELGHW
jgi:tetratricopeptide (TPR) repeat protein